MYALIDCNNFFVSCERVFNPKLRDKPVVILSNNDGCIIARSEEAKALGIPMGAPYFQWEAFLKRNKVIVQSSNYSLYGDFSFRVMQTLEAFNPEVEIYSIDEAFLKLSSHEDPIAFGHFLKQKIFQWTGIPVSIGIGRSKTLAKVANHKAKKNPTTQGVYALFSSEDEERILQTLSPEKIWGIGKKTALFLQRKGIFTAAQFKEQEDSWLRKNLTVTGLRTAWELRGHPCLGLEEIPPNKQSIMTSRSFREGIRDLKMLEEAVSSFTSKSTEKLRCEKRLASALYLFIMTSPHHSKEPLYSNSIYFTFPEPTAYTPQIISYVKIGLSKIYKEGFLYKKAGVLLTNLIDSQLIQQDFLISKNQTYNADKIKLMNLMDDLNQKFGFSIVHFAAEGIAPSWKGTRKLVSPSFTTSWEDLLIIDI